MIIASKKRGAYIDTLQLPEERNANASCSSPPSLHRKEIAPLRNLRSQTLQTRMSALPHGCLELDFRKNATVLCLDTSIRGWKIPQSA